MRSCNERFPPEAVGDFEPFDDKLPDDGLPLVADASKAALISVSLRM